MERHIGFPDLNPTTPEQQTQVNAFISREFNFVYQQYLIAKRGLQLTIPPGKGSFYDLINVVCPEYCQLAQRTIQQTFEQLIDLTPESPEFMKSAKSREEDSAFTFDDNLRIARTVYGITGRDLEEYRRYLEKKRTINYYLPRSNEVYEVTFANRDRSLEDSPYNPESAQFIGLDPIRDLANSRRPYPYEEPHEETNWNLHFRRTWADSFSLKRVDRELDNARFTPLDKFNIICVDSNFPGVHPTVLNVARGLVERALDEFLGKSPTDIKPFRERIINIIDLIAAYLPPDYLPSTMPLSQLREGQAVFLLPQTRDIIMSDASTDAFDEKLIPKHIGSYRRLSDEEIERLDTSPIDNLASIALAALGLRDE